MATTREGLRAQQMNRLTPYLECICEPQHRPDQASYYYQYARARLLYHLAHGRKMDLENYIYTLISMLGFQTDKRHTTIFPALISGICEAAGVQISPAKSVMKAKGPINRFVLENARRHTA
ncbi:Uncharacterized protein Adt_42922 [Abeliophyllum distichum]|uniref:Uncharacterized protein n=1 Tax=Abeliophyllum distichum TaxID=126358 RepID=A0ABD1PT17_9LAMI